MADQSLKSSRTHSFWNTQPVPQTGTRLSIATIVLEETSFPDYLLCWDIDVEIISIDTCEAGPIINHPNNAQDIANDPVKLPDEFEWTTCDVRNTNDVRHSITHCNDY
jgi:hypothetical protein